MAAALKAEFGVDSELIVGEKGIFDVHVDGERVYCKHERGGFPEHTPLIEVIRART